MGGYPLVELDEFVDLRAGQLAAALDQLVQPLPGVAVRHDEGVDIHQAILVGSWPDPGASSRVA